MFSSLVLSWVVDFTTWLQFDYLSYRSAPMMRFVVLALALWIPCAAKSADDCRDEIENTLVRHSSRVYGDDIPSMLFKYDGDGDGHVTEAEVTLLMKDAGISEACQIHGNGIISHLDKNGDGKLQKHEL